MHNLVLDSEGGVKQNGMMYFLFLHHVYIAFNTKHNTRGLSLND